MNMEQVYLCSHSHSMAEYYLIRMLEILEINKLKSDSDFDEFLESFTKVEV